MGSFLLRAALTGVALWVVTLIVPGISFVGGDTTLARAGIVFVVAVIFGLVNAIIKPIVQIISIPLYILTLGLIHIVINALMLWITSWITEHTTHWGLYIEDFWWTAIWAAIVLSIVSWLLSLSLATPDAACGLDRHTGYMPELPEVEALADHLRRHAVGLTVGRIDVSALSVLKTFDPPINVLHGQTVTGANRWGKYLGMEAGDLHLITHLSRAGWLRWSDKLAAAPVKPGKGPIALRVHLGIPGEAPGFDLTEAGTQKRLAVWLVDDPAKVPGIAALGPDALSLGPEDLAGVLAGNSGRIKTVITDQKVIAGIGNAYSDEILHVAKLSPFATAGKLTDAQLAALHDAMISVLTDAVERSVGQQAATLKGEEADLGCGRRRCWRWWESGYGKGAPLGSGKLWANKATIERVVIRRIGHAVPLQAMSTRASRASGSSIVLRRSAVCGGSVRSGRVGLRLRWDRAEVLARRAPSSSSCRRRRRSTGWRCWARSRS